MNLKTPVRVYYIFFLIFIHNHDDKIRAKLLLSSIFTKTCVAALLRSVFPINSSNSRVMARKLFCAEINYRQLFCADFAG